MDPFDLVLIVIGVILLLVIVGLIVLVLLLRAGFKHTFVRKIVTGGRFIKVVDKFKEYRDRQNGAIRWRLLKAKHIINRAPEEVIDTDEKGNMFVEAYYLGDINYVYSTEKIEGEVKKDIEKIEADIEKAAKKSLFGILRAHLLRLKLKNILELGFFKPSPVYIYPEDNYTKPQTYKPITSNQRLIAFEQTKKAFERKQKGIMQHLPLIIAMGGLVMIFAIVFIFGGELVGPISTLHEGQAMVADKMADVGGQLVDTSKYLAQIIDEKQYITSGGPGGTVQLLNGTAP